MFASGGVLGDALLEVSPNCQQAVAICSEAAPHAVTQVQSGTDV
jgi:hypothetical protein